ncbi:MAG: hypothetical protein KBT03_00550 [Bacteroidales bacterium]|nr:hypothetical protein [Candidatus Scybalousia scybalohippi]
MENENKKEIMETKETAKSELVEKVNTTAVTTADEFVDNYKRVLAICEKATWEVAKVVFETVKSPDFKSAFGTIEKYGEKIGLSKGQVSNLVKSYGRKELLHSIDNAYSLTQVQEFNALKTDNDVKACIEAKEITADMTCKEIRKAIKEWENPEDCDVIKVKEIGEESETTETTEKKDDRKDFHFVDPAHNFSIMFNITDRSENKVVRSSKADTVFNISPVQAEQILRLLFPND